MVTQYLHVSGYSIEREAWHTGSKSNIVYYYKELHTKACWYTLLTIGSKVHLGQIQAIVIPCIMYTKH